LNILNLFYIFSFVEENVENFLDVVVFCDLLQKVVSIFVHIHSAKAF